MAKTAKWNANLIDGGLLVTTDGPISYADGLKLAERVVMLCGKGFSSASRTAVAAAPGGGKGPKKGAGPKKGTGKI